MPEKLSQSDCGFGRLLIIASGYPHHFLLNFLRISFRISFKIKTERSNIIFRLKLISYINFLLYFFSVLTL